MMEKAKKEEVRIGVFICNCGSNIAGHLDCKAVTAYAATLPGVVFTKENLYTCSESGIAEIQKAIKENLLNRVVVASCSPRTHQPLFQSSCAQAGLNPYLFEMVNIRDQCSWVHMQEREEATEKAKDLVRMGAAKAAFLEPQKDIEASLIPRVLIIGGGMAGLSAADGLSALGLEVILIEKAPRLGGLMTQIHRVGPEGDSASERIAELIRDVESRNNVVIHPDSQLLTVRGYIGNFEVTLRTKEAEVLNEKVGCIVVATGAVPYEPVGMYGYDGKSVVTLMGLEERLREKTFHSDHVVIIQCVGARCPERTYCSRICCMTAVKNARLIKEMRPDATVHILYRDIQMYGTEKERMLWEARGLGVRFEVYDPETPPVAEDGKVRFDQPLTGIVREIPFDLLVLSTPLVARDDAPFISQLLRVPMDQNQFFLEAHAKLRPLDFATDGVFVCGSARYPATVDEARTQGMGVASRVATILFKDRLITSALVAEINPATCVGCKGCLEMCPYGAITYLPDRKICEVNMILCKGCGCCSATCPSHSALLKGFKPQQLLAQIRAASG